MRTARTTPLLTGMSNDRPGRTVSYATRMRAASREHVSSHGTPTTRLSAPGAILPSHIRSGSSEMVPLWIGKHGLAMSPAPGERPVKATPGGIEAVLESSNRVLMPVDRYTAAAAIRECKGTAPGRGLNVLTRLPVSPHLIVLSTALAHKFWTPAGANGRDIATWARLLGTGSDPAGYRQLIETALDGEVNMVQESLGVSAIRKIEQPVRAIAGKRGAAAAATMFSLASSLSDAWSFYERTDNSLRSLALARGEVVALTGARHSNGLARARLSTPCKMKPRKVLIFGSPDTSVG